MKKTSLALGSAFIASATLALSAQAGQTFSSASLSQGYQVAAADTKAEHAKCGASKAEHAKCGASKAEHAKCGASKAEHGQCGASKPHKAHHAAPKASS